MPSIPAKKTARRAKLRTNKVSRFKLVLPVVIVVSISSLFLSSILFFRKLTAGYASAQSASSYDITSESFYSVAYIVVEDFLKEPHTVSEISFIVLDKDSLKIVDYKIPVTSVIDVPGKFGTEPFSNILALGGLNETDTLLGGVSLVNQALLRLFAFPVDRFILVDSAHNAYARSLLHGETTFSIFDIDLTKLDQSVKTNFSLKELFELYKFANSLPKDRLIERELTTGHIDNTLLLDEEILDITFSSVISDENKSVAVLNGTDTSGVANFGARLVRNLGGRVVAIGNTYEQQDKSIIIANDPTSTTARVLAHALKIEKVITSAEAQEFTESEISRADITIIVGLDLALSL